MKLKHILEAYADSVEDTIEAEFKDPKFGIYVANIYVSYEIVKRQYDSSYDVIIHGGTLEDDHEFYDDSSNEVPVMIMKKGRSMYDLPSYSKNIEKLKDAIATKNDLD